MAQTCDPGPEPPKDLAPKAFQWAGIQGNRFATSIFAKLLEDKATSDGDAMTATKSLKRVKLNLNALEVNFFTKKKVDTAKEAKPSAKKKTVATCLDSKRSQAVEIFLNGAGVKLDQVKACLVELDEKAVAIENLQRILEFYPNAEEVPLLKEFQQERTTRQSCRGAAERSS
ncbi:unnamed protein product [Prorocentrum cordatum]|uniref:FH2 domain-containing protein n=1 Tax=Prorocentrum cordatum TaxID=2364126 RepID=A0ABN9T5T4_9DINO|nr:unnamed protein product [Polarella glacialis]